MKNERKQLRVQTFNDYTAASPEATEGGHAVQTQTPNIALFSAPGQTEGSVSSPHQTVMVMGHANQFQRRSSRASCKNNRFANRIKTLACMQQGIACSSPCSRSANSSVIAHPQELAMFPRHYTDLIWREFSLCSLIPCNTLPHHQRFPLSFPGDTTYSGSDMRRKLQT